MPFNDLREFIEALEAEDELSRVSVAVNPKYEAAAVVTCAKEKAILFEKVMGSQFRLVGNLFGNLRKMEILFGWPRDSMLRNYLERIKKPIPPQIIQNGPIQQNLVVGDQVDLSKLPIPIFNALDGGPYITAGIVVARDPEFGNNLALHRLQVQDRNKLGIDVSHIHHLHAYHHRAEIAGKPLEVAIIIGCAPQIYVASQVTSSIEVDEYEIAGAIAGQPLELIPCKTVGLEVPATAELILEGRILPGVRVQEGPFGEFSGYYGPCKPNPVIECTALRWRDNAYFHAIFLGKPPTENIYLTTVPKAADLYQLVKECVAEPVGVYLTPGGCGRYHAVVSIKKRANGEPKLALSAVLASRMGVKHAVVVDDDIDIYDPHDVEWAIATRSQFDLDSIVFSGAPTALDPSVSGKRGSDLSVKVGIDATKPIGRDFPKRAVVPDAIMQDVKQSWSRYGLS